MAELSQESQYAGAWGDEPVSGAHGVGNLLLSSAEDSVKTLCRVLDGPPFPVFGHVVIARAAIELCARSRWVLEVEVGGAKRVQRGQAERLYSAQELIELGRLGGAVDRSDRAKRRIEAILEEADRRGWKRTATRKRPASLKVERPGFKAVIDQLFAGERSNGFGRLIAGSYSAVAHGTLFGLLRSVDLPPEQVLASVGRAEEMRGLYANSADVNLVLTTVAWAHMLASHEQARLFGWESEVRARSEANLLQLARQVSPGLQGSERGVDFVLP